VLRIQSCGKNHPQGTIGAKRIEALGPDGDYYKLKADAYPYDNTIGDLGGYFITLEKK